MNPNTSLLEIPKANYVINYLQGPEGAVITLKKNRKALRKGVPGRRIIKKVVIGEYEFSYHATRGWRKNKV